ncbi:hypothetical protein [Thermostaphylospora chromogena]|uniref:Cell division protein FtsL n=1 Tax=Thermostaphylospora chromogena TaxID=35622 RepID=A0A1H1GB23_9ACTN|nr:hypothetical protein [Thermostaphylospora chromogena]SDR10347.1 hypothetical protein SAMN04489764_3481 [Thermostaphylospora chromogena]
MSQLTEQDTGVTRGRQRTARATRGQRTVRVTRAPCRGAPRPTASRTTADRPSRQRTLRDRPARVRQPAVRRATSGARPRPGGRVRPPRTPFVLLVVGLLCGGLVSLLLLNIVLARDSFTATELRRQNKEISLQREKVMLDNVRLEGPAEVARRAEEQGMRLDWDSVHQITPDGKTRTGSGAEDVNE